MRQVNNLTDLMVQYIEEKRAFGYKYRKNEQIFKRILKLAEQMGHAEAALDRSIVMAWCEKTVYETEMNRQNRISVLRGLTEYMTRLGYPAYSYSIKPCKSGSNTYQPHIFTNEELAKIFTVSENLPDTVTYPFRSREYTLIMKMLYSTGMRSGELMHLKKEDVCLAKGLLHICDTKLNKERFIPVDDEMLKQTREYDTYIRCFTQYSNSEYFFFNSEGAMLTDIYHPFRKILRLAGISHGGRGYGPRVHDLRYPNQNKIQTFLKFAQ